MKEKPARRRCDARNRRSPTAQARALGAGGVPRLRKLMRSDRCRNWALPGSNRCRLHGGHSTGPLTPEGTARTVYAMKQGRHPLAGKSEIRGQADPLRPQEGRRNRSIEEREQAAYEKECTREWRAAVPQSRTERQARRMKRREERKLNADLAARQSGFMRASHSGRAEEWEAL